MNASVNKAASATAATLIALVLANSADAVTLGNARRKNLGHRQSRESSNS
jgi:hypothetical protein